MAPLRWGCLGMVFALAFAGCRPPVAGQESSSAAAGSAGFAGAFADRVIAYNPVTTLGWPAIDPSKAIGPPGGPLDAVPLGFDPQQLAVPPRGSIVLGFGSGGVPHCAVNGNAADLVIASSAVPAVDANGNPGTWSQVLTVEVSNDDVNWYAFPQILDPSKLPVDPLRYPRGFAGVTPTAGTGPAAQGGDAFDLGDIVGLPPGFEACYIRMMDAGMLVQDYGSTQPDSLNEGGAVDAVRANYTVSRPATAP